MLHEKLYQEFLNSNKHPRQLKSLDIIKDSSFFHLIYRGKKMINFSSSDYLGLSKHPYLIEKANAYTALLGTGTSSSRLVTGNYLHYERVEDKLAKAIDKPAALLLASGYQTNISVLESLLDKTVLKAKPSVFADKLCHSSMLNMPLSLSELHRFQHNNYDHLAKLLEKYKANPAPKFILAESIYSMEGDRADILKLIHLAKLYDAFLYLDDAHSVGIDGKLGFGSGTNHSKDIPLMMGTFSKALGSFGGYVGCSTTLKNYLVNKCKGFIYSTGIAPAMLGAIDAAIDLVPELHLERKRLKNYSDELHHFFKQEGLNSGDSDTHIIPWIIGDANKTREISLFLEECGILGTAIQPPTVPLNKSRIRFCLSAAHSEGDIEALKKALKKVKQAPFF